MLLHDFSLICCIFIFLVLFCHNDDCNPTWMRYTHCHHCILAIVYANEKKIRIFRDDVICNRQAKGNKKKLIGEQQQLDQHSEEEEAATKNDIGI